LAARQTPSISCKNQTAPRETEKPKNELQETILKILSDKTEKNARRSPRSFHKYSKKVTVEEVADSCHDLARRASYSSAVSFFQNIRLEITETVKSSDVQNPSVITQRLSSMSMN